MAEVISKIQTMRRDSGLEVMDHIKVSICGNDHIYGIVNKNNDAISTKVLAEAITADETLAVSKEWNINGEKATICIEKSV